jgi:hypothetical protein
MRKLRVLALAGTCLAAAVLAPNAGAEPHAGHMESRGGFERPEMHEPYRTPHWEFYGRFQHNHFYPAPGYAVPVLPPDHLVVNARNGRLFFQAGVWYRQAGTGFMVVRPPLGVVVPILPPAYATVWAAGVPYYYANDIYYVAVPAGYAVAQPPLDPSVAPPPQAAVAPAPAGNW